MGGGYPVIFDDETFLGQGPLASAGISRALTGHLSLEGEVSVARHYRDSGYLGAEGTPVAAVGRLMYLFGRAGAPVRGFASGGVALVHSTGTFRTPSIVEGPGGHPVTGPPENHDWTLTQGGYELGGGVLVRASDRVAIRPEFRWLATGTEAITREGIGPPLWIMRPSLSIVWRLR